MDATQDKALRAPFAPELISLLPKVSCKACTDSQAKHCGQHQKSKCQGCGAWITTAHVHLSYVGHAETTDRFLSVDPEWTWEPLAFDGIGLPAFDGNGGLWMRVTIAGVTRLGYGDAQGKKGPNAVKEAIGDGLRNAGMRFGVALDLWAKSDLAAIHADKETGEIAGSSSRSESPAPVQPSGPTPLQQAKAKLWDMAKVRKWDMPALSSEFEATMSVGKLPDASVEQINEYIKILAAEDAAS